MINKENFNILNYVKKEEYTGSMDGMRYMLKKISGEEMEVIIWPEPYSYGHTDEGLKQRTTFPLSKEGVEEACDYLNEQYVSQKSLWDLNKR
ncbi:MAG: hypothetical protein MJZ11_03385 [Lachnospiraceae bacterium]|nr:hypothetical protein [Lachnospiraceae bacterium]